MHNLPSPEGIDEITNATAHCYNQIDTCVPCNPFRISSIPKYCTTPNSNTGDKTKTTRLEPIK